MTGFGRGKADFDTMSVTIEIKSVNHRYCEFSARTPRAYGFLEERLKAFFSSAVSRGKTDCFVQIERKALPKTKVVLAEDLAAEYFAALNRLSQIFPNAQNDIKISTLAHFPDVLSLHADPEGEDEIWAKILPAASEALRVFSDMRAAEGQKLEADIKQRAENILRLISEIEEKAPEVVKAYRERLFGKLSELLESTGIDSQRILTEAAIFADKTAVDEETVRLRSHISQLFSMLESKEPTGRKLDFLVQEMNREANTIGSKCQNSQLAAIVIDMKAEIEKIREQVQNIE
jgi:uncharacterized protein (TIGR00255 family)